MEIIRQESLHNLPCPRGYAATICIRCFKGRRDVLVHLFRPTWELQEERDYPWESCIDTDSAAANPQSNSREVLLESFSRQELDTVTAYLAQRYADRLVCMTTTSLSFPVPAGLIPLRAMPEGKDMGRIRFDIVPGYPLPFSVHGFYDLRQHKPMDHLAEPLQSST